MNTLHEDDELGLAEALHAAAGQIEPSVDAWSTNVTRVRQRRRTTQVGAVLGAVVIAGGTVTGVALARNHSDSQPAKPPSTVRIHTKLPFKPAAGPYSVWHYYVKGQERTYYVALSHDDAVSGKLLLHTGSGRSDRPISGDMWDGWTYATDTWPRPGRPVVGFLLTGDPGSTDPYLTIGFTRLDVTELTAIVKTKVGSKWSAPRRVPAQIYGRGTGLRAALYAVPFETSHDHVVRYEGRLASGKSFTSNEE